MNVGIVTTWFERGAAYVSRQYMNLLEANGHHVFIYARGGEKQAQGDVNWDKSRVTWGKVSQVPYATAIDRKDFLRWITNNSLNVVLFNEQHWMPPVIWARDAGLLTVAYIDYYTEKTIPFFAVYDGLVCNTKRHYSAFDWHDQCIYVPWGTNIELFNMKHRSISDSAEFVFFHSAGMNPYRKGTDLAIDAVSRMKNKSLLIIHSQVNLINELQEKSELITKLLNEKKIRIIEGDITAPGLYYLGDAYVYPSRLEGIGLTQVEALASGLPLIAPDFPPMNEFVNEETGVAIPIDRLWSRSDGYYWPMCQVNVDHLSNAMDMMVTSAGFFDKKIKARRYAESALDWSINGKTFVCWLESIKPVKVDSTLKNLIYNYYPSDTNLYWMRSKIKKILGL